MDDHEKTEIGEIGSCFGYVFFAAVLVFLLSHLLSGGPGFEDEPFVYFIGFVVLPSSLSYRILGWLHRKEVLSTKTFTFLQTGLVLFFCGVLGYVLFMTN